VNALKKKKKLPHFGRDGWTHSVGLLDPALDLASLGLARSSVVIRARSTGLIDGPRDLIESPR